MKNLIFLIVINVLFVLQMNSQPLTIGAPFPDLHYSNRISGDIQTDDTYLKGKVTILEFWATWCGPCLTSMKHLDTLKQQFGDQLQILAVGYESEARIARFQQKMNYNFDFITDEEKALQDYFPHRIIPHAVIVGPDGHIKGMTNPDLITATSIEALLAGERPDFPLKAETSAFDFSKDYFAADSLTQSNFVLQPGVPAYPTFSRQFNQGPFAHRRISYYNATIEMLYQMAYQFSGLRTVVEADPTKLAYEDPRNHYFMDIIVAPEDQDQLFADLQRNLNESFDIKAKTAIRTMEVAVIYRLDSVAVPFVRSEKSAFPSAKGDRFESEGATFEDFATYLENFNLVGLPVIDETNDDNRYQLSFHYFPEDPKSFKPALKKMGLGIKKATRAVEVLVLFDSPTED